jgi:cell division protein ZapA
VERLVKFDVLGQEYPLYTDVPEEDVQEILRLVRNQLEEAGKVSRGNLPANKIAILTSLNMASKYVKLKREFSEYQERVDKTIGQLTAKIEKTCSKD